MNISVTMRNSRARQRDSSQTSFFHGRYQHFQQKEILWIAAIPPRGDFGWIPLPIPTKTSTTAWCIESSALQIVAVKVIPNLVIRHTQGRWIPSIIEVPENSHGVKDLQFYYFTKSRKSCFSFWRFLSFNSSQFSLCGTLHLLWSRTPWGSPRQA